MPIVLCFDKAKRKVTYFQQLVILTCSLNLCIFFSKLPSTVFFWIPKIINMHKKNNKKNKQQKEYYSALKRHLLPRYRHLSYVIQSSGMWLMQLQYPTSSSLKTINLYHVHRVFDNTTMTFLDNIQEVTQLIFYTYSSLSSTQLTRHTQR